MSKKIIIQARLDDFDEEFKDLHFGDTSPFEIKKFLKKSMGIAYTCSRLDLEREDKEECHNNKLPLDVENRFDNYFLKHKSDEILDSHYGIIVSDKVSLKKIKQFLAYELNRIKGES